MARLSELILSEPTFPTLGTFHKNAIGVALAAIGVSEPASAAWPTANMALAFPFVISKTTTVKELWCSNGATASGNVDIGIYDETFAKIISTGSVAQSGTDTCQQFDITDTVLVPGTYYLALSCDNGTATFYRFSVTAIRVLQSLGVYRQLTAFPLPSTMTPAFLAATYFPDFGLATGTVLPIGG